MGLQISLWVLSGNDLDSEYGLVHRLANIEFRVASVGLGHRVPGHPTRTIDNDESKIKLNDWNSKRDSLNVVDVCMCTLSLWKLPYVLSPSSASSIKALLFLSDALSGRGSSSSSSSSLFEVRVPVSKMIFPNHQQSAPTMRRTTLTWH